MAHCEVTHKQGWTKGATAIQGLLGLNYHPVDKANSFADCLENI
jgi:hypothetical protein